MTNFTKFFHLADTLSVTGHTYASKYRAWIESVKQRHKDCNIKAERYKTILEAKCDSTSNETKCLYAEISTKRKSNSSNDSDIADSFDNNDNNGMSKKKAFIVKELMDTENAYINDLQIAEKLYIPAAKSCPLLSEKDKISLFANIKDIETFQRDSFLKELKEYHKTCDYDDIPHAFLSWNENFIQLYVKYCVNHPNTSRILSKSGVDAFFRKVQEENLDYQNVQPIQSILIKPVQRIVKYSLLLDQLRGCLKENSNAWKACHEALTAML